MGNTFKIKQEIHLQGVIETLREQKRTKKYLMMEYSVKNNTYIYEKVEKQREILCNLTRKKSCFFKKKLSVKTSIRIIRLHFLKILQL